MKERSFLLVASAILGLFAASSAQAQLVTFVSGVNTPVKTKFTFWVDPATDRLTIEVDNRYIGEQHAKGTVTGFGFNLPTGNGADVTLLSQTWTVNAANHSTTKWSVVDDFQAKNSANYQTEVGVWSKLSPSGNHGNGSTPKNGVRFGDVTTFVFQVPAFTPAQQNAFYSGTPDLVVRWQSVDWDCKLGDSDRGFTDFPEELPPVPEPSTYGLMGAALLGGLVILRRRKRA